MQWWVWLAVAAGVVGFVVLAVKLRWIDLSDKSGRGGGVGGALGSVDEIFSPKRYESMIEVERQSRLPAPSPIPGDKAAGFSLPELPEPGIGTSAENRFKGSVRLRRSGSGFN